MKSTKGSLDLVAKVACKSCKAKFKITPKDCARRVTSVFFGVTCPRCKNESGHFKEEVEPSFWLEIPAYEN